jgi:hypothetical protein
MALAGGHDEREQTAHEEHDHEQVPEFEAIGEEPERGRLSSLKSNAPWPMRISRRFSTRSAMTPPNGETTSMGMATMKLTAPEGELTAGEIVGQESNGPGIRPFMAKKKAILDA